MVKDSSITNYADTFNFKMKRGQWVMVNGQWVMDKGQYKVYTVHCKMDNGPRVPLSLRLMNGIEE